jgi:hypothetical protein
MGFRENSSNLFYYTDICFGNMRFLYIFLININFIDKKKNKKKSTSFGEKFVPQQKAPFLGPTRNPINKRQSNIKNYIFITRADVGITPRISLSLLSHSL